MYVPYDQLDYCTHNNAVWATVWLCTRAEISLSPPLPEAESHYAQRTSQCECSKILTYGTTHNDF